MKVFHSIRLKRKAKLPAQTILILSSTAARNVLAVIHPRSAMVTNLFNSSGGLHWADTVIRIAVKRDGASAMSPSISARVFFNSIFLALAAARKSWENLGKSWKSWGQASILLVWQFICNINQLLIVTILRNMLLKLTVLAQVYNHTHHFFSHSHIKSMGCAERVLKSQDNKTMLY